MKQTHRGVPHREVDGSQRVLDGIVRGVLLLVIVTGVLLHRLDRTDNADPTLASSLDSLTTASTPEHTERRPVLSTPADPVADPSAAVRRGGDNQHVEMPDVAPLSVDELATYQPNELGHIPVLMYHAFTTNPEYLGEWTTTPDQFRDDLRWLDDHGFFIVSIADLITNEISVPPGRHPVVLTFDDASPGQFRLLEDETGARYPDPTTAVGVLEAFFTEHPDFGRGGHFAFVPNNCFHHDAEVTTCEERLTWLAEHGYEIGNHTWYHQNLADADDDRFMSQIGDTKLWIDERVPGDANLSNVLTLPFGEYPATEGQHHMLLNGFDWKGQRIQMVAVLTVQGGISVSPSSAAWNPWAIARFNTDDATLGFWKEQIDSGAMTLYTSDGNPALITIPEELPEDLVDQFDPHVIAAKGRSLLRYSAEPAGEPVDRGSQADGLAADRKWASARRKQPARVRRFV